MRIGLHIGKFHWAGHPDNIGPKLAEIARTADDAGFYSVWVMDHLFQLGDLCRELADLGFDQVIFNMSNVHEIAPLELMGQEVIPAVGAL